MAERTIHIFDKAGVTVQNLAGGAPRNGDVIGNALNGNAFSWEVPDNLQLSFPASTVAITFDDADGILSDDPYSNADVLDQRLTQPVSLGGQTYTPSGSSVRWQWPPPVTVEHEYSVILFDSAGTAYEMVGVSITQGYSTTVVGVMFNGATPPPGTVLYYLQGTSTYNGTGSMPIPPDLPCFLAGTRITTPSGPRAIETLKVGDRVLTLDRGPRRVRWIGRTTVTGRGALAPVRFRSGSLGNRRDLRVSPNHRMLLQGARVELYFGTSQVLVAAKHLVDGQAVQVTQMRRAEYLHLAFDRHEMIFAEGVATESLFTGPAALASLDAGSRAELAALVPGLRRRPQILGRRALTRAEARVLLSSGRPVGLCLGPTGDGNE